jgi:type IX secretion system PorP/SprF family membrane protein
MKRLLPLLFISVFTFQFASAQQKPQYTQYVLNNLLINPAVTGIENYFDVKSGYRSQWTGLQGAPVTSYITGSVPFGSDFVEGDPASLSGGNDANPYGRLFTQTYQAAPPHHGLGFIVVSDQAGPISTSNIDLTYAYHLGISSDFNLSVGVEAGYNHTSLNTSMLVLENPLDPAIANGNNSQWKPDLGAGIWGYSSNYYFGISALQLLSQNLYFSTNNNYSEAKTVPQFFVTGGVKFFLNDDVTLMPSVLVKFISPLPVTYDINAKLAFRSRFWVGVSYRNNDAVAGMLGLNISSLINISYSYDYTTSALNTVSGGTHEIVIGIMLGNRNHLVSPVHSF